MRPGWSESCDQGWGPAVRPERGQWRLPGVAVPITIITSLHLSLSQVFVF